MMFKSSDESIKLEESTPILADEKFQAVHHVGGLTVFTTIIFLIGEIIGVCTLALPNSLARSGYPGVIALIVCGLIAVWNGSQLGWSWNLLLKHYPEYRQHCRYPYSAIGEKACGKWMRYLVAVCVACTCLTICVIYIVLASENLHSMLLQAGADINFCLVMVVFAGFLVPLSWFGSPKDFKWIAVLALISASAALILLFVQLMIEVPTASPVPHPLPSRVRLYFLSLGPVLAGFSALSTFPTIQHDMRNPKKFTTAISISYAYSVGVYLTIAISGYYVYGQNVSTNILLSLPNGPIKITIMALYVIHLVFAYIIFLNPPVQNMEEALKIPNTKCNWRRLLFRSAVVAVILFLGESAPHFGALVDFLGGTSSSFLTFVAPPVFYMLLCKAKKHSRHIPVWMKLLNIAVIVFGVVAGAVSTYATIIQLSSPATFVPPCYVNWTAAQLSIQTS